MTIDGTDELIVEGELTANDADNIRYSFCFRSTEVCAKFVQTDERQWYGSRPIKDWQRRGSFVWGLAIRQHVPANYGYEEPTCAYVVDKLVGSEGRVSVRFWATPSELEFTGQIDAEAVRNAVAHHSSSDSAPDG